MRGPQWVDSKLEAFIPLRVRSAAVARLPQRPDSTHKAAFYIFCCCCLNLFCTRMFNSHGCYFEQCLLETKGGPSAGLFAEETLSCQVILGADGPAVTLYFGFHPGLRDTHGIQRSHRAHPGSFPLSSGALSARLSCSPSRICDA